MEQHLRSPIYAFLVVTTAFPALADGHSVVAPRSIDAPASEFALGGSVERAARLPAETPLAAPPREALSMPLTPINSIRRETSLFGVVLFADEGWDDGREAFRVGTAYTTGAATAGVSMTYIDEGAELSRSELYIDYALSQNFSVGLAGILDNDFTEQDDPIPQLGVNAAFSTEGGAFVEGGISNAESSVPLFGLSIGLRF